MTELPLFPTSVVGSWPRSRDLLRADRRLRSGEISEQEFRHIADPQTAHVLELQESAGVDVVTDGELRRDNFFSFVAGRLGGVQLMTLAEMFEVVEDRAGFRRILDTLDVPSYALSNAVCVGRITRARPLAVEDLEFAKAHTTRPIKVTLPGPYLLTRSMWVGALSKQAYPEKEDLGEDVVRVLRTELEELARAGASFVQFDEPVLTELVFTQGQTRTFMCAALAARKDPAEELEFATDLMNQLLEGAPPVRIGVHVCRGNWSRNESTLLRGNYEPLAPYFRRFPVKQLVLEYATERAGPISAVAGEKELGLGVVNPRTDEIETPEAIAKRVGDALAVYPPEKLWLNPDCGFATFSRRPVNDEARAVAKLRAMVEAAKPLRAAHAA